MSIRVPCWHDVLTVFSLNLFVWIVCADFAICVWLAPRKLQLDAGAERRCVVCVWRQQLRSAGQSENFESLGRAADAGRARWRLRRRRAEAGRWRRAAQLFHFRERRIVHVGQQQARSARSFGFGGVGQRRHVVAVSRAGAIVAAERAARRRRAARRVRRQLHGDRAVERRAADVRRECVRPARARRSTRALVVQAGAVRAARRVSCAASCAARRT
jgi:hypothetical protein